MVELFHSSLSSVVITDTLGISFSLNSSSCVNSLVGTICAWVDSWVDKYDVTKRIDFCNVRKTDRIVIYKYLLFGINLSEPIIIFSKNP